MEEAFWYLLVATQGGANRVRIVRALSDQPCNANQLADRLSLTYNTVRHHLDSLEDHDVVRQDDHEYGKLYFLTDRFERNRAEFERITEELDEL